MVVVSRIGAERTFRELSSTARSRTGKRRKRHQMAARVEVPNSLSAARAWPVFAAACGGAC
ncbi:hypothetical protein EB234_01020 [Mesorhizobium japonicum R7A]|nr:hypothetical protein EB234_01020 [Mesorhizobium japonicum R7A]